MDIKIYRDSSVAYYNELVFAEALEEIRKSANKSFGVKPEDLQSTHRIFGAQVALNKTPMRNLTQAPTVVSPA